ncbi:MAG: hypothetical protein K6G21_10990 [Treponema sp.]|nr:hypothetical protein [Treponema sp.]
MQTLDFKDDNRCGVFIDGEYYASLFKAGIDSGVSFQWLSTKLHNSRGAPVYLKILKTTIVSERWIRQHPEYLI